MKWTILELTSFDNVFVFSEYCLTLAFTLSYGHSKINKYSDSKYSELMSKPKTSSTGTEAM